jgi:hypothetical protein
VVREALAHDLNGLLDTAAFDASAATSVRPAGLFASATAVTPTTPAGQITVAEAMITDLQSLAGAVSDGAPDADVVFVVNPSQALRLAPVVGADRVIPTGYVAAGTVGALDAGAVATMLGDLAFQASIEAAVHMSDAPAAASIPGSPNAISAPLVSLFQADLIGLRSVLKAAWKLRRSGASALATGVAW